MLVGAPLVPFQLARKPTVIVPFGGITAFQTSLRMITVAPVCV
jgi:hypothetical protein